MGGPGRGARPGPSGGRVGGRDGLRADADAGRMGTGERRARRKRIKLGWTPEDAASRPVRSKRTARTVTVGGETLAIHEWSERTGIPTAVISSRLSIGWTPERAVGTPARRRHRMGRQGVVIGGERPTIREWVERTGIPANVISNRLNRGWTPERAVGTPVRPRRRRDA